MFEEEELELGFGEVGDRDWVGRSHCAGGRRPKGGRNIRLVACASETRNGSLGSEYA